MKYRIHLFFLLFFIAFQTQAAELKLTYTDSYQLKPGDSVFQDQKSVGSIKEITVTDEGLFLFTLDIDRKCYKNLTEFSQFYAVYHPEFKDKMIIEILIEESEGKPLERKMILKGTEGPKALSRRMKSRLKHTMDQLSEFRNQFSESIRNFSDRDDVQNIKNELQQMGVHIQKMGKDTKRKFNEEILPQLEVEMEKLRNKLKERGKSNEIKELDREFQKIKIESAAV